MFDIIISVIMSNIINKLFGRKIGNNNINTNKKLVDEISQSFDLYVELKKKYEAIQKSKKDNNEIILKGYQNGIGELHSKLIDLKTNINSKNTEQENLNNTTQQGLDMMIKNNGNQKDDLLYNEEDNQISDEGNNNTNTKISNKLNLKPIDLTDKQQKPIDLRN